VRGPALARLGRARSTERQLPRPPRPARSWPERRSRGPQPAAVRPPPPRAAARVPVSRVAPTASKARCGSCPNAAAVARTHACCQTQPCAGACAAGWGVAEQICRVGRGGGGGSGRRQMLLLRGCHTHATKGTTHGTPPLLLHLQNSASSRLPRTGPTSAGRCLTTHFQFPAKTIHTRCLPKRIWLAKWNDCMAKWSECMAKCGACVPSSSL